MANPNIWVPGTALDANSTIRFESFTASASQSLFTITSFAYVVGTGSLMVFVSGIAQRPGIDFIETSANSFTLSTPVDAGTIILAQGLVEITGNVTPTNVVREYSTAVGGETNLTHSNPPTAYTGAFLSVYRNGLLQQLGYDYTVVSQSEILLSTAAEADDVFTFVQNLTA